MFADNSSCAGCRPHLYLRCHLVVAALVALALRSSLAEDAGPQLTTAWGEPAAHVISTHSRATNHSPARQVSRPVADSGARFSNQASVTRGPVAASESPPKDTVWLVSTRRLSHAGCLTDSPFVPHVKAYAGHGRWRDATLDELNAANVSAGGTSIFVHGNDTSSAQAIARGLAVYRSLAGCRQSRPPTCFVIWSWPSERRLCTIIRDVAIKARLTDPEAFYLARFLEQLPGETPIGLAGYSFGVRVLTGALHLTGGGELVGNRLGGSALAGRQIRALFMAAALDQNWLVPGGHHGLAISQLSRLVVLVNPRDRVLRWFPRLPGGQGGQALGFRGLNASALSAASGVTVKEVNVFPAVRRKHAWPSYIRAPAIIRQLRKELLVLP